MKIKWKWKWRIKIKRRGKWKKGKEKKKNNKKTARNRWKRRKRIRRFGLKQKRWPKSVSHDKRYDQLNLKGYKVLPFQITKYTNRVIAILYTYCNCMNHIMSRHICILCQHIYRRANSEHTRTSTLTLHRPTLWQVSRSKASRLIS